MLMNSTFPQENKVFRGWGYSGFHLYILKNYQEMTFSAIVALSEFNFYGILINSGTNNKYTFAYFLSKLVEARKLKF